MAAGNDASFLHICRSDIDTSETAIHAPETYAKARENLEAFVRKGYLVRDEKPSFYIYRQIDLQEFLPSYAKALAQRGITLRKVCSCNDRLLLLVYRQALLEKQLQNPQVLALLAQDGYPISGTMEDRSGPLLWARHGWH